MQGTLNDGFFRTRCQQARLFICYYHRNMPANHKTSRQRLAARRPLCYPAFAFGAMSDR